MHLRRACLLVFLAAGPGLSAAPSRAGEHLLRAGTPEGLPGYTVTPQGKLLIESAPKRRVLECVESQLGLRFVWQALPTKRLVQELAHARLDIAFPMGFSPERARQLRESAPTWDNPDVWLSRRPLDLNDQRLRLAARLGSPQQVEHAADGYTKMVGYLSYGELVQALALDLTDAVIVPQSVYRDQQALWPADTLVTPGRPRRSGFYLPPSDPQKLAAALDRAIERCRIRQP